MQPYERFEAWQRAHQLAIAVYGQTKSWPSDETFGLTSQVRRSAFSVPVNIVEGSARRGGKEFKRFLSIAFASLAETGYTLRFAKDVGILSEEAHSALEAKREDASRLLFLLMRSLGS